MIEQEKIDAIKGYVDVAPFMQACGIALKMNGKGYKGHCPFHDDKNTPSLSVTPGKNLWQCFGCGKGGDIIEFVPNPGSGQQSSSSSSSSSSAGG